MLNNSGKIMEMGSAFCCDGFRDVYGRGRSPNKNPTHLRAFIEKQLGKFPRFCPFCGISFERFCGGQSYLEDNKKMIYRVHFVSYRHLIRGTLIRGCSNCQRWDHIEGWCNSPTCPSGSRSQKCHHNEGVGCPAFKWMDNYEMNAEEILSNVLYSEPSGWCPLEDFLKALSVYGCNFHSYGERNNKTDGEYEAIFVKEGVRFKLNANTWKAETFEPLIGFVSDNWSGIK